MDNSGNIDRKAPLCRWSGQYGTGTSLGEYWWNCSHTPHQCQFRAHYTTQTSSLSQGLRTLGLTSEQWPESCTYGRGIEAVPHERSAIPLPNCDMWYTSRIPETGESFPPPDKEGPCYRYFLTSRITCCWASRYSVTSSMLPVPRCETPHAPSTAISIKRRGKTLRKIYLLYDTRPHVADTTITTLQQLGWGYWNIPSTVSICCCVTSISLKPLRNFWGMSIPLKSRNKRRGRTVVTAARPSSIAKLLHLWDRCLNSDEDYF